MGLRHDSRAVTPTQVLDACCKLTAEQYVAELARPRSKRFVIDSRALPAYKGCKCASHTCIGAGQHAQ
jgi:hypothetical protein